MGGDGITLQNVPNYDEFTLNITTKTPCDEIKPFFWSLIRHFFKKFDGPRLCLISLVRLGLEIPTRGLSLCVGP
jgi:hypothetical protein